MPTTTATFFISAVTDEFASYRGALATHLDRPGVRIETQEKFLAYGDATLLKLDDYIARCDAVIHLVGDRTGGIASEANRAKLLSQPQRSDLAERLGLDAAAVSSLSYTQWEAWLAEYHGRKIYIATPTTDAPRGGALDDAAQAEAERQSQRRHLDALRKRARYPEIAFASSDKLCIALLHALHDLLPPVSVPISSQLPPSLGRLFKGRDEWLVRIRQALQPTIDGRVDASRVALWGMGGLGKTRLAAEYAHTFAHEYSALLFVSATTPEDLKNSLAELTGALRLPQASSPDRESRLQAALEWLDDPTHRGWFLLIDNVDDEAAFVEVETLLRRLHRGRVILTGRLRDWPDYVIDLELDLLQPDHAVEYLLDATAGKRLPDAAGQDGDRAQAALIAKELDGLALGLTQAAHAIRRRTLSFADYLAEWRTNREELLDDPDFDPKRTGYPRTVAVTWKTSYNQLPPASVAVFDALCWLAPDPIPERLITKAWKQEAIALLPEGLQLEVERNPRRLLLPIYDFCLAERPEGPQRLFTIHRLVQDVGRLWQRKGGTAPARAELALRLVEADFVRPGTIENLTLHILPELRATAPHVLAVLEMPGFPARPPLVRSRLRRVLATMRWTEGRLAEAVLEAQHAVAEARAAEVSEIAQATLAQALSELTSNLESQGDFPAALAAATEAVTLLELLVKKEPENVAHQRGLGIELNNVGRICESQGNFGLAQELFAQSQGISELLVKKEPENLAYQRGLVIELESVGRISESQGDFGLAQELFARSQGISELLVKKEPENLAYQRDLYIDLFWAGRAAGSRESATKPSTGWKSQGACPETCGPGLVRCRNKRSICRASRKSCDWRGRPEAQVIHFSRRLPAQ